MTLFVNLKKISDAYYTSEIPAELANFSTFVIWSTS